MDAGEEAKKEEREEQEKVREAVLWVGGTRE